MLQAFQNLPQHSAYIISLNLGGTHNQSLEWSFLCEEMQFYEFIFSTEDNVNIGLILVLIISTKIRVTYDNYTRQGDTGFPKMSKTLPLPKGHSAANFQASLEHTLLSSF